MVVNWRNSSMKSYRQPKRKRVEICRKPDECMDVAVKKPANGTVRRQGKATESIRTPLLESSIQLQIPSTKIKLQLFPINEQTRLVLEKDGHNPFLELTLKARKKISSVVRHLNSKWESPLKVIGQLMLFPYNTKLEQLASCRRWTSNDLSITAWEVYADVGTPSIFRLRYGWFSNLQQQIFDTPPKTSLKAHTGSEGSKRGCLRDLEIPNSQDELINESFETSKTQINVNEALDPDVNELKPSNAPTDIVDDQVMNEVDPVGSTIPWADDLTNLSIGGLLSEISLQGKINRSDPDFVNESGMQPVELISDISIGGLLSEASLLGKMSNHMKLENESSWQRIFLAPSDASIGGILSEASLLSNKNKLDGRTMEAGHEQIQSPWDDTFTNLSIGGLLAEASLQAKTDSQTPKPSCHEPGLSILDAEETCHAFPIRKLQPRGDATTSSAIVTSSGCSNALSSKQSQFPDFSKMKNETVSHKDSTCRELKTDPLRPSLGAFDKDSSL